MRCRVGYWRVLAVVALIAGGVVAYQVVGHRLYRDYRDWQDGRQSLSAYRAWHDACRVSHDPLVAGLANRRIRGGESFPELLLTHPPTRLCRHGPFHTALYGDPTTGATVLVAEDGRLASAFQQRDASPQPFRQPFFSVAGHDEAGWARSWTAVGLGEPNATDCAARTAALAVAGVGAALDPVVWSPGPTP